MTRLDPRPILVAAACALCTNITVPAAEPANESAGRTAAPAAICSVHREVYVPSPAPKVSPDVGVSYVGGGLRRREIHSATDKDDVAENMRVHYSDDNGRTWLPFSPLSVGSDTLTQKDIGQEILSFAVHYDPTSKRTVEMLFQRLYLGDPQAAIYATRRGDQKYFDHGQYRLSDDDGRTWTQARQLIYEKGPPFNSEDWADPAYLHANQVYGGYGVLTLADGRLAYPAVAPVAYEEDEEDRRVCKRVPWMDVGKGFVPGVLCFFGTWNESRGDYEWTASKPISVPRRVSTRGLEEPALAQFTDGTLMLEMRGSNAHLNPKTCPGRKWVSLSKDGGRTWSPATDLRFDDGEPFQAPSSFARMLRSSKTGKLYWVGNISKEPVKGNSPRYPLYIAEIDEQKAALKRGTLTAIDDRAPTEPADVQLSNFSLLENRETKDLEIYLTRIGERPGTGNVYKYTLKLLD
ncbi:MAG: exo-alpha-sialidase [Planctomycetia bacterium]|nr:exo-alpha-sialidase [Planctomycetia bacterium]